MATPPATPATTESSTLYFGPWYRRSPFFEKTLEAGCSAYDIYNHMYLPGFYADPVEEYWALLNGVTLWDVSVERIVEITGPGCVRVHEHADLPRPDQMRRRARASTCSSPPRTAASSTTRSCCASRTIAGGWPSPTATPACGRVAWRSTAGWTSRSASRRSTRSRSRDPSRTTRWSACSAPAILDIKYYWTLQTEVDGIPVVISRTGWTGEVGYEIYLRDPSRGAELWDRIMAAGAPHGIRPIAPCEARRIEAGIFNYGSDITINDNPFQVMGLERLVEPQDADYIGKAALEEIRARGVDRKLVGIEVDGDALPFELSRKCAALHDGSPVGTVTDLIWSPRLETQHRLRLAADRPGRRRDAARDRGARRRPAGRRRTASIPFIDPKKHVPSRDPRRRPAA